jgi:hypothetical protein
VLFPPRYHGTDYIHPQVFIIDDAASMREDWDELCRLFEILGYLVKKSDEDGIDLYFTMTEKKHNNKNVSALVDIAKKRKNNLQGFSNINGRLDYILGQYCRSLQIEFDMKRGRIRDAPGNDIKPLSVYVFTNALWGKTSNPKPAIEKVVDRLTEFEYPASQVGIQFISFGHDSKALKRLKHYDSGLDLKMYASKIM